MLSPFFFTFLLTNKLISYRIALVSPFTALEIRKDITSPSASFILNSNEFSFFGSFSSDGVNIVLAVTRIVSSKSEKAACASFC